MKEVQKRRRKKGIVWMPVMLLCVVFMAGCGSSGGLETISIESIEITQNRTEEAPGTEASSSEQAEEESTDAGSSREDSEPSDADAAEVNGIIAKIEGQSFQVSEFFTEEMEDGLVEVGPVGVGPAEVKYTDETVFIIRSSQDMGVTHSDREGNAGDLEIGRSVTATGMRDGDVFTAEEIVIYFF